MNLATGLHLKGFPRGLPDMPVNKVSNLIDFSNFLYIYFFLADIRNYGKEGNDAIIYTECKKSDHTDKKETKLFLRYKEIKRDRVQSHICLTASSYMGKNLLISSYIGKPFLVYDFAPGPI
jgi:hypothetical protein